MDVKDNIKDNIKNDIKDTIKNDIKDNIKDAIKNDINWLKERKFVTEIGTPDKLNTRDELRSYITQVGIGVQLEDEISDEGESSNA